MKNHPLISCRSHRLVVLLLVIGCTCFSCKEGRRSTPDTPIVLEEGKGVIGLCEIGEEIPTVRKVLPVKFLKTTFEERGVGTVKEYSCGVLLFTTIDEGSGERITRISTSLTDSRDPNTTLRTQEIRTRMGLGLSPASPALADVLRIYGSPDNRYSADSPAILDNIRNGESYEVRDESEDLVFMHYPSKGISFLVSKGEVMKCSIEECRSRRIWRY